MISRTLKDNYIFKFVFCTKPILIYHNSLSYNYIFSTHLHTHWSVTSDHPASSTHLPTHPLVGQSHPTTQDACTQKVFLHSTMLRTHPSWHMQLHNCTLGLRMTKPCSIRTTKPYSHETVAKESCLMAQKRTCVSHRASHMHHTVG